MTGPKRVCGMPWKCSGNPLRSTVRLECSGAEGSAAYMGVARAAQPMERLAYRCLIGAACAAAFSLPLGRLLLAASLSALVVMHVRSRSVPRLPAVAWCALTFMVVAALATIFGVDPERAVPKLRKLLWFLGIPVTALLVTTPRRLSVLLTAFAAGCTVLALWTCVELPLHAVKAARLPGVESVARALIVSGSMTDAQRLMLGTVVTLGLLLSLRSAGRRWGWWLVALGAQGAALIVNFKRGSWFCAALLLAVYVTVKAGWKHLLALGLCLLGTLFLPPVRARLRSLGEEWSVDAGGRMTMWTKVAPALIRKHPMGVGYRALTNRMMRREAYEVERRRDHLHSNVLQVLVATGWAGLGVYLVWMTRALVDAVRFLGCSRRESSPESAWGDQQRPLIPEPTGALILLLLLLGLLINGFVEYNFGDAELVLVYSFVMGAAAAGTAWCPRKAADGAIPSS